MEQSTLQSQYSPLTDFLIKHNAKENATKIIDFKGTFNPTKAKYIKVKAYNFGKLPEWHQGFGGDAFIFIDEITVK